MRDLTGSRITIVRMCRHGDWGRVQVDKDIARLVDVLQLADGEQDPHVRMVTERARESITRCPLQPRWI